MSKPRNSRNTHRVEHDIQGKTPEADSGFERLLDSIEAAALLRIHPKTLRRKARIGAIPGVQVGKLWRFRVSALNEWLGKIAS